MTNLAYLVIVIRLPAELGGGYLAIVPDLKGCEAVGGTPEDAFANAQDAIVQWCAEMRELGREIPNPDSSRRVSPEQIASLEALLETQHEKVRAVIPEFKAGIEALKTRVGLSLAVAGDDNQLGSMLRGHKSLPRGVKLSLRKSGH